MIEQIKQNVELMHQLEGLENAQDYSKKLSELGFKSSYLTLKNKDQELQDLEDGVAQEERRLQYDEKATQFGYEAGEYTKDQVMLVRAADVFSVGNVLKVPKDGQVISYNKPTFSAYDAVLKSLGLYDKRHDYQVIEDNHEKIKDQESKMYPCLRQYRSTKHFTLNTLVGDNGGGSWTGMPYVYFEKMAPHLNDKELAHIAPHDTFFRGDVKLIDPTLMLKQESLQQLLSSGDPKVIETLKDTNLIVLDNNCEENASMSSHVGYVLRYLMKCPYYNCSDHGVNIQSDKGVFSTLVEDAAERGMTIGGSHFYTKEKKMDDLHFARNIAEDQFKYLNFVRNNDKFNLTELQIYYFDKAIQEYNDLMSRANDKGYNINFTEENTPIPAGYIEGVDGKEFDNAYSTFLNLSAITEEAFERSEFYENVDLKVLEEETTKYNEQFKEDIKQMNSALDSQVVETVPTEAAQ